MLRAMASIRVSSSGVTWRHASRQCPSARKLSERRRPLCAPGKRIEGRGFPAIWHAPLQYEFLAGREMSQVLAQRRNIIDPSSAVATDVGFGDQRKFQTG